MLVLQSFKTDNSIKISYEITKSYTLYKQTKNLKQTNMAFIIIEINK